MSRKLSTLNANNTKLSTSSSTPTSAPKTSAAPTPAPKTSATPSLISPNTQLTFSLKWADIQAAYTKELIRAAKFVKVAGFRVGHVPPTIAQQHLDGEKLYQRALDTLLSPAYSAALQKSGKKPITQPDIAPVSMKPGEDWQFSAAFAEAPIIILGNYKDVARKALKKAEEEIKKTEEKIRKTESQTKTIVKTAKEISPEKNPAQSPSPSKNPEPKDVKTHHVFQALIDSIKPAIPELLVRQEVTYQLQRLAEQLQRLKLTAENYLKSRNLTGEELQREYTIVALTTLQLEFILSAIAKDRQITVTDQEIDALLQKNGGEQLTPEQKNSTHLRSYVFSTQLKQKVLDDLLSL